MKETFLISKQNGDDFIYLGLSLIQSEGYIQIHQDKYISEINSSERKRNPDEPISKYELEQLKATIGQLNWVATQTRQDISFETCQDSISFKEATVTDIMKKLVLSMKTLVIWDCVEFPVKVMLQIRILQVEDHKEHILYFCVTQGSE